MWGSDIHDKTRESTFKMFIYSGLETEQEMTNPLEAGPYSVENWTTIHNFVFSGVKIACSIAFYLFKVVSEIVLYL